MVARTAASRRLVHAETYAQARIIKRAAIEYTATQAMSEVQLWSSAFSGMAGNSRALAPAAEAAVSGQDSTAR
jgi:hypothetical protein